MGLPDLLLPLLAAQAAASASPAALLPSERAVEVRRLDAAEARQGVVADRDFVYAISNSRIAKLDKRSGRTMDVWEGDPAQFIHMNSCSLEGATLACAASNYPEVPMASSVEWFDARTLRHLGSRSFGPGRGSLTWLDWHRGSWWACFAHYGGKGGEPGRDNRWTRLVRLDRDFREQEAWLFPKTLLDRMAPYSSSGGSWGSDGLLYVTGHDHPELYALRLPEAGSRLELVATVAIPTNGQAIAWDASEPRLLWSIERSTRQLVASRIPELAADRMDRPATPSPNRR